MLSKDILLSVKNALKLTSSEYITQLKNNAITQFNEANSYYRKVTGIVLIDKYQARVVSLQDELLETQKRRREIGNELSSVRKSTNLIHEELLKVKRQDNYHLFLDMMKEETELLKRETEISNNFQELDKMERDIFAAFTNAIRDSQEKQQERAEFLKYVGLILTIVGSGASYLVSSLKTSELKDIVKKQGELQFIQMKTIVGEQIEQGLRNNGNKGLLVQNSQEYEAITRGLYDAKLYMSQVLEEVTKQNKAVVDYVTATTGSIEEYINQNNKTDENSGNIHSQYFKKEPLVLNNSQQYVKIFLGLSALFVLVRMLGG